MKSKLHPIKAYLDAEEYRQFRVWVQARGVGESGYIREQLSFDVKLRGAPKGVTRKRKVGRPKTRTGGRIVKVEKPLFEFEKE